MKIIGSISLHLYCIVIVAAWLSCQPAVAAELSDHSYLPPWMLAEARGDKPNGRSELSTQSPEHVTGTSSQGTDLKKDAAKTAGAGSGDKPTPVIGYIKRLFASSITYVAGQ